MTLHSGKFHSGKSGQSGQAGQAMTEMVIAASFVLVPLFLLIPLLGKYIDLKHSAIQAARYEAWEYTVWYENNNEAPATRITQIPLSTMPEKSIAELQAEARQRFFSREAYANIPTTEANDESDLINEGNWDIADANPLWQDHLGNSLLANTTRIESIVESDGDTPNPPITNNTNFTDTTNINKSIFVLATGAGRKIADLITGNAPDFEIDRLKGYSQTEMTIPIESQPGLVSFGTISGNYALGTTPNTVSFSINSRAAVLTDGWNAGGRYHTKDQVGQMTIARKLKSLSDIFTALTDYQDIINPPKHVGSFTTPKGDFANLLECGDERRNGWGIRSPAATDDEDGSLWTGYVDNEAIHPDRLHALTTAYTVDPDHIGGSGGGHDCPEHICNFTYDNSLNYDYPWADPAENDYLVAPDDCIN